MNIKLLAVTALLFLFTHDGFAQDNQNSIEFTPIVGLKLFTPEKNSLKGPLWGGELAYHFNMTANKADYVRLLNIKSIDAVASYRNMEQVMLNGDPSTKGIIGSTFSIMGRLEFGLAKAGPFQLLLTPGLGVLYSTESYFTDPRNPIIGSHINIAAQAGLKIFTAVSGFTGIQGGVDVFHYSNGAVRLPNNGVNAFAVSLGLVQKINQSGPSGEGYKPEDYKGSLELGGDIGYRGLFKIKDGSYKSGLYLGYDYRLSKIFSIKLATDACYFYTVFDPNRFEQTFQYYGSSYDRCA